jgi:hypothetical protein
MVVVPRMVGTNVSMRRRLWWLWIVAAAVVAGAFVVAALVKGRLPAGIGIGGLVGSMIALGLSARRGDPTYKEQIDEYARSGGRAGFEPEKTAHWH